MPFYTSISIPKTKTDKVWGKKHHCPACALRGNPCNSANVSKGCDATPKAKAFTRFVFPETSVAEDVWTDQVILIGI